MSDLRLTEDSFRALARSSPWRWQALHFRFADDAGEVEAWLARPGRLRVRDGRGREFVVDERDRGDARRPEPRPRWPHEVTPVVRPDGLVAERPASTEVAYDDPMWQSYDWVAVLDPVELSHHTAVADLQDTGRLGRRTWWARMRPLEGYEPRCGCCPLLWSQVSDRDENAGWEERDTWRPEPGTLYPEAYDVALDVGTGVLVERRPVGPTSLPMWHRVEILDVTAW